MSYTAMESDRVLEQYTVTQPFSIIPFILEISKITKINRLQPYIFIEDAIALVQDVSLALLDKLIDLAFDKKPNPKKRELKELYYSCDGLIDLFDNILKFMPNFQTRTTKEAFDLDELIQTCLTLIAPYKTKHNLKLKIEIDKTLPRQYIGDKTRIMLIFLTLLITIIFKTFDGKITIQVKQRIRYEKHINLSIELVNTGYEISENFFDHVCQQIHKTLSSNNDGSFSDIDYLTTAKKLADQINSTLAVSTTPHNVGLQFTWHWHVPLMINQIESK